jgi:hypothetical protein
VMTQRMTIGILALFSTAVLSASQAPTPGQDAPRPTPGQETPRPTPPTQTPPTTPSAPAAQAAPGQMTMAGCLYREGQDWILADASMAGQAKPGATPGATGTTGQAAAGQRFKVSSLPDDKLKDLSGKRVEVSGRIDQAARGAAGGAAKEAAGAGGAAGAAQAAVQQFQASSIKEVSGGTCPATPAPAK